MYQGNPSSAEGVLYGDRFATYDKLPERTIKKGNYTDTADSGEDYLCSVCYETGTDDTIYITDVLYTPLGMEATEPLVAAMLQRNGTRTARIESNNGGRGFGAGRRPNCVRRRASSGSTSTGTRKRACCRMRPKWRHASGCPKTGIVAGANFTETWSRSAGFSARTGATTRPTF